MSHTLPLLELSISRQPLILNLIIQADIRNPLRYLLITDSLTFSTDNGCCHNTLNIDCNYLIPYDLFQLFCE